MTLIYIIYLWFEHWTVLSHFCYLNILHCHTCPTWEPFGLYLFILVSFCWTRINTELDQTRTEYYMNTHFKQVNVSVFCVLNVYEGNLIRGHVDYCRLVGLLREYDRDTRWLLKRAEKSDHFLGKIEGVSSLPIVYLPCIYDSRWKASVPTAILQ